MANSNISSKDLTNYSIGNDFIGVILAAGVGSRLRPMTSKKPKCLVKTAGKPILEYQIDAYRFAGVKEILIVVGYEGLEVRNFCKHIKDLKIKIIENNDYENTNNMYSFYLAKDYVNGRSFIINNADLSIDISIIKKLIDSCESSAVAVDSSQFNKESMKVSLNSNGFICDISKNIPKHLSSACSIDFYKFLKDDGEIFIKEVVKIIEEEKNLRDWTEVALQRLFQTQVLRFSICDIFRSNWVEIDNYEDLAISDRKFSKFDEIIKIIKTVFLDLDGTIYVGANPIRGVAETISQMQQQGKEIYFLSNNSSKNKADYVQRLTVMGIDAKLEQIILSTDGVVNYLKDIHVKKIHILGTNNLKKIFIENGFEVDSTSPEYVIIGYDTELNYNKIISACRYINAGVEIIATHCDVSCPSEYGPIPDVGALLEMIKLTTGKLPIKIFGKPMLEMVVPIIEKRGIDVKESLFVGDRLHTDILMAKQVGAYGLLVLSGETSREQLEDSQILPDCVLNSLADVYKNNQDGL